MRVYLARSPLKVTLNFEGKHVSQKMCLVSYIYAGSVFTYLAIACVTSLIETQDELIFRLRFFVCRWRQVEFCCSLGI